MAGEQHTTLKLMGFMDITLSANATPGGCGRDNCIPASEKNVRNINSFVYPSLLLLSASIQFAMKIGLEASFSSQSLRRPLKVTQTLDDGYDADRPILLPVRPSRSAPRRPVFAWIL